MRPTRSQARASTASCSLRHLFERFAPKRNNKRQTRPVEVAYCECSSRASRIRISRRIRTGAWLPASAGMSGLREARAKLMAKPAAESAGTSYICGYSTRLQETRHVRLRQENADARSERGPAG